MKKHRDILQELSSEYQDFTSFRVKHSESIHDVVNSSDCKKSLPSGFCKMVFYNAEDLSLFWRKNPRTTGTNPGGQNIFSYFNNTGGKTGRKWQHIRDEMGENNINEIEVTVFWNKKENSKFGQ